MRVSTSVSMFLYGRFHFDAKRPIDLTELRRVDTKGAEALVELSCTRGETEVALAL